MVGPFAPSPITLALIFPALPALAIIFAAVAGTAAEASRPNAAQAQTAPASRPTTASEDVGARLVEIDAALAQERWALALERVANHVGDLGALAGDVGFLPTASFCGRIRGDVLNLTALLCGSRFGRGMVRPGHVGFDVDAPRVEEAIRRLETVAKDTAVSANLLWETPSVQARFEGTGRVTAELAEQIGLVGPAARASNLERDVRHHHPYGIYRFANIPLTTWDSGDVFARAYVRWLEIQRSLAFVGEQLRSLPLDTVAADLGELAGGRIAVSMVEGWRGEICHVAISDEQGGLSKYKIVDPSFHNWTGLAIALRGQQISDFPLCNKSFNLSYCGHDL